MSMVSLMGVLVINGLYDKAQFIWGKDSDTRRRIGVNHMQKILKEATKRFQKELRIVK